MEVFTGDHPATLTPIQSSPAFNFQTSRPLPAAIAPEIVVGEADYALALMGNQASLYKSDIADVDQHLLTDFADCGAERLVVSETRSRS